MSKIYSVNEINSYITNKLNSDMNLFNISIKGEISNLKKYNNCYYLTLKDKNSLLQCIIFKNNFTDANDLLKEGMNIIASGTIKGYVASGKYSFLINNLVLDGLGDLYLQFETLKKFYQEKGYFNSFIKKPIPLFPKNIGILTALTGAAIKDIISTINKRFNIVNIYMFPCVVQGENAPKSLANNIRNANNFSVKLDVIILGRGGGSFEDLSAFSNSLVIEEIYKSKIPIISAVGHEIDFQLSDFVADKRAETPTAAAVMATPNKKELEKFLKDNFKLLLNNLIKKIQNYNNILNIYKNNYHLTNLNWIYKEKQILLKNEYDKIIKAMNNKYKNTANDILTFKQKLKILNPNNILLRGFSIVKDSHGVLIKSLNKISIADKINVILSDGKIDAKVENIEKGG